uniref:Bushy growth protein n=1 Tax=Rhizophora mucronata TaxID=61149 RepID=A0A2P2L8Q1_RHIMU
MIDGEVLPMSIGAAYLLFYGLHLVRINSYLLFSLS